MARRRKVRPDSTGQNNHPSVIYEKSNDPIGQVKHKCTDIICLILFFILLIVQLILSVVVYVNGGDPRNLILPHDSSGNLCTGDKPNLFYFNLAECITPQVLISGCSTTSVCVSQCSNEILYYLIPSQRSILFDNYCSKSGLQKYYNSNVPSSSSVSESSYFDLAKNKICPLYALNSKSLYGRCLPSLLTDLVNSAQNVIATDSQTNQTIQISDFSQALNYDIIAKGTKYIGQLLNIKGTGLLKFFIFKFRFKSFYFNFFFKLNTY
jgi:hypothetical protein